MPFDYYPVIISLRIPAHFNAGRDFYSAAKDSPDETFERSIPSTFPIFVNSRVTYLPAEEQKGCNFNASLITIIESHEISSQKSPFARR